VKLNLGKNVCPGAQVQEPFTIPEEQLMHEPSEQIVP